MDIKEKIQQEAEKRYPGKTKKAGTHGVIVRVKRIAFIAGASWLLSEIGKENDGLKARIKELDVLYERLSKLTSELLNRIEKVNTAFK